MITSGQSPQRPPLMLETPRRGAGLLLRAHTGAAAAAAAAGCSLSCGEGTSVWLASMRLAFWGKRSRTPLQLPRASLSATALLLCCCQGLCVRQALPMGLFSVVSHPGSLSPGSTETGPVLGEGLRVSDFIHHLVIRLCLLGSYFKGRAYHPLGECKLLIVLCLF